MTLPVGNKSMGFLTDTGATYSAVNTTVAQKTSQCIPVLGVLAHVEITNPTELVRWRAVSEKRSYGNQDHQENSRGFPGDSVVKNSPANEGDVG